MRGLVLGIGAVVAACTFRGAGLPSDAAMQDVADPDHDVATEASPPGCAGTGLVVVCPLTQPSGSITLAPGTLNTDTSSLCVPFHSPTQTVACVVAGTDIAMSSGTLTITGSKPLVLVATTGMIHLSGSARLDAGSHLGGTTGPAANAASCPPPILPRTQAAGGGGAGGSFGGTGGDGGDGAVSTGSHGSAGARSVLTGLRGGCRGSDGASSSSNAGLGGNSGGALYLIAAELIQLDGGAVIDASGAPGSHASTGSSGGGGGGSGGMIGLEATLIAISGGVVVFANGAGGGEGSGTVSTGLDGQESSSPIAQGLGGSGGTNNGGDGGSSSAGSRLDGVTASDGVADSSGGMGGGGGGGGGAGVIVMRPLISLAITVIAPPAM